MMSLHSLATKIKLCLLSDVILLTNVDPIAGHKDNNDPGYHDGNQGEHPQLDIDVIGICCVCSGTGVGELSVCVANFEGGC